MQEFYEFSLHLIQLLNRGAGDSSKYEYIYIYVYIMYIFRNMSRRVIHTPTVRGRRRKEKQVSSVKCTSECALLHSHHSVIRTISLAPFIKAASSSSNSLNICMAWLTLDFNTRHLPLKCPSRSEMKPSTLLNPAHHPKVGKQILPSMPVHSGIPFRCPCRQPGSLRT